MQCCCTSCRFSFSVGITVVKIFFFKKTSKLVLFMIFSFYVKMNKNSFVTSSMLLHSMAYICKNVYVKRVLKFL